ncbi:MAG: hypothetical protein NY202_00330 [Mollicutes bacterium UO1]
MPNIKNSSNMKKNESDDLLLKIIRHNAPNAINEFKGSSLHLATENITAAELGQIIGKPVSQIIGFF